jgi:hypothetical protein
VNAAVRTRITRAVAYGAEIAGTALLAVGVVMGALRAGDSTAHRHWCGGRRLCITYPEPFAAPAAESAAAGRARRRIAVSIFWINAIIAQWPGRGLAEYAAVHFDELPSVILDTKEQLFLRDPSDSALIVRLDGSARVQFQFENQPP